MYCENCQFEIEELQESQCPLCGGPLVPSAEPQGRISLDASDSSRGAFVLEDDEDTAVQTQTMAAVQGAAIYGNQDPLYAEPPISAVSQAQAFSDTTTDMLDQALDEFDPMVDEHFKVKKKSSSKTMLLLLMLLVCVAGAGAYFYFFMMQEEPEAPPPAVPAKIAQPRKPSAPPAAAPEAQKPATPVAEVPAVEKPAAPAPDKPATPAAALPAEKPVATAPAQPAPAAAQKEAEPAKAAPDMKKQEPAAAPVVLPQEKQPPVAQAAPAVAKPAPVEEKAPARPAEDVRAAKVPPPAPAAPSPAAMPKTGKTAFSIMTDSCRVQANADAEISRLRKQGYDARIMQIDLGRKGVFYRVLIGSYASRAEAQQMNEELRSKLGKQSASIIPVVQ